MSFTFNPFTGNLDYYKTGVGSYTFSLPLSVDVSDNVSITQATTSTDGYLDSTDWNTFNDKEPAVTKGNLTETTSSVLTVTGGTGAIIGSGVTIEVEQADTSNSGYLSSTDWNIFNDKVDESTTVSDTDTVDLTLSTYDITADVNYQDSDTIDFSDDASGYLQQ